MQKPRQMSGWITVVVVLAIIISARIFTVTLNGALYPSPDDQDVAIADVSTTTPHVIAAATATRPVVPKTDGTLLIPSIGVNAGIEKVGINGKGNISSPSTFQTVAWYTGSSKPGEPGLAIIDGHVNNGLGLAGVFTNLDNIAVGNDIYVNQSSGQQLHFRVKSISYLDYTAKLDDLTQQIGSSTPELVLLTCTGDWIPNQKTYDKRMVVVADLTN